MRDPGHSHPGRGDGPTRALTSGRPARLDQCPPAGGLTAAACVLVAALAAPDLPAAPAPAPLSSTLSSGPGSSAGSSHPPAARSSAADVPEAPGAAPADTLPRFVGIVRSRQTGEGVGGAQVRVPGQGRRTVTDDSGRFLLDSLHAGQHEVRVHYLGYTTNPRTVELRPRHSTRVELWLERTVLAVEDLEVEVEGPRPDPMAGFRSRREGGFGTFLDRGDIEARDPAQTSDLFRSMAGVRVSPNRMGTARVTVGRFGGRCSPSVYLDGVPTAGMPVDFVLPESIVGIEVYRGPSEVPAQFNRPSDEGCGTILIWTRNPGHTPPGVEPDSTS